MFLLQEKMFLPWWWWCRRRRRHWRKLAVENPSLQYWHCFVALQALHCTGKCVVWGNVCLSIFHKVINTIGGVFVHVSLFISLRVYTYVLLSPLHWGMHCVVWGNVCLSYLPHKVINSTGNGATVSHNNNNGLTPSFCCFWVSSFSRQKLKLRRYDWMI